MTDNNQNSSDLSSNAAAAATEMTRASVGWQDQLADRMLKQNLDLGVPDTLKMLKSLRVGSNMPCLLRGKNDMIINVRCLGPMVEGKEGTFLMLSGDRQARAAVANVGSLKLGDRSVAKTYLGGTIGNPGKKSPPVLLVVPEIARLAMSATVGELIVILEGGESDPFDESSDAKDEVVNEYGFTKAETMFEMLKDFLKAKVEFPPNMGSWNVGPMGKQASSWVSELRLDDGGKSFRNGREEETSTTTQTKEPAGGEVGGQKENETTGEGANQTTTNNGEGEKEKEVVTVENQTAEIFKTLMLEMAKMSNATLTQLGLQQQISMANLTNVLAKKEEDTTRAGETSLRARLDNGEVMDRLSEFGEGRIMKLFTTRRVEPRGLMVLVQKAAGDVFKEFRKGPEGEYMSSVFSNDKLVGFLNEYGKT